MKLVKAGSPQPSDHSGLQSRAGSNEVLQEAESSRSKCVAPTKNFTRRLDFERKAEHFAPETRQKRDVKHTMKTGGDTQ